MINFGFDTRSNIKKGIAGGQSDEEILARSLFDVSVRSAITAGVLYGTTVGAVAIAATIGAPVVIVAGTIVVAGIGANALYSTYKKPIQDWTTNQYNTIETKVANTVNQTKDSVINAKNSIVDQGNRVTSWIKSKF